MNQVQLTDQLYKEAQRRAREAGFASVDEFVADRLESDFSDKQENFDAHFTPEVVAHLDRISEEMKGGKSVSMEEVDKHLADVREAWLKTTPVNSSEFAARQISPGRDLAMERGTIWPSPRD